MTCPKWGGEDAIQLFVVRYTAYGHEYEFSVELWPGYGIVAPRVVTSNGSAGMVADQVAYYINRYNATVEPVAMTPLDPGDAQVLRWEFVQYLRNNLCKPRHGCQVG